jgi:hypothetical protein
MCGLEKPLSEFYRANESADGYRTECKVCNLARRARRYREDPEMRARDIARVQKWQRDHAERHSETQRRVRAKPGYAERMREGHLKRKYGMTPGDYERLLAEQDGRCAICGGLPADGQSLHVDHCHESGLVRGLLCFNCNAGLGMFDHDGERLGAAATYLRR